jgi:hypothetical protein
MEKIQKCLQNVIQKIQGRRPHVRFILTWKYNIKIILTKILYENVNRVCVVQDRDQ